MGEETPDATPPANPNPLDHWRNRRRMAYISLVMLIGITVGSFMNPEAAAKIETLLANLAYTFGFIVAVGYMGSATFSHVGKK